MNKLLTAPEVAELLQVAVRTVWVWTREGELPHYRIGNRIRYDPEEVTKWIKTRAI